MNKIKTQLTSITRFCRLTSLFLLSLLLVFFGTVGLSLSEETKKVTDDDFTFEDTVVTATKRAERAQDIPQSITAFSADELSFMGARNFSDMLESVPGVELRNSQGGFGDITMRGISEMSGVEGGPGAAVGYYLDELPLTMSGIFPDVASFDMERVEVLRGPQGSLYGAGSMAGTIRMISNKPDPSGFDNNVDLTYSNTKNGSDNYAANAMLNLPLIKDKMALRVVAAYEDNAGFIDQTDPSTGAVIKEDVNDYETTGGRMALRFIPSDTLTMDASLLYSESKNGRQSIATEDFTISADSSIKEFNDDELLGLNLTMNYELPFADLISATSYFDRDMQGAVDNWYLIPIVSGFNAMMAGMFPPPGFGGPTWITPDGVYSDQTVEAKSISQELRMVSKGDGPLQWVSGVFYKKQKQKFLVAADTMPATDPAYLGMLETVFGSQEALLTDASGTYEQYAVFGELSYDFSDKLTLAGGGRYFHEERDAKTTSEGYFLAATGALTGTQTSSGDSTLFNPKLLLRYKFTDNLMSYMQYSKGFRSGGQNVFILAGAPAFYDPETLDNYEIGLKSVFWDGRARFNMAAFHMVWHDLQAKTVSDDVGANQAVDNVGDAHSTGIDVEFSLRPIKGLTWSIGGNYLKAETDDDYTIMGVTVPAGTALPDAAELTFNTAVQYNVSLTDTLWGFCRASYSYTGETPTTLGSDIDTPAYEIVNFRVGIEKENWQLTLFVDNMFDEKVAYWYLPDTTDLYSGASTSAYGSPRTIGVSLRFNF